MLVHGFTSEDSILCLKLTAFALLVVEYCLITLALQSLKVVNLKGVSGGLGQIES